MVNLTQKQFLAHKNSQKPFPIFIKNNADEITPIGIYYNLQGENKFLFESVNTDNQTGRYSFIGFNPYMSIKSFGENIEIKIGENLQNLKGKVLDYVKKYTTYDYNNLGLDIPFVGGAIGYVGYDVIGQYEVIKSKNKTEIDVPQAYLMFYKIFICLDHFKHTMSIVYNVLPGDTKSYTEILALLHTLESKACKSGETHDIRETNSAKEFTANYTKEKFCSLVNKAKEYIKAGDIYQVVISQRLKFKTSSKPFDVFRRLRCTNPSPYLFYIDFKDFQVIGSSPESLVTVKNNKVMTNPIAGTRPRGKTSVEDAKFKEELLTDEKERAEHVMLVDLGRNDIGKISEFGSVKLDKFMDVDFYSHVMHIVSMVSGELTKGLTCFDALISCLPVGTVSGAPKIRAMEIIEELEETKRGIYSGAIGYFSYDGNMDTCIAIRTLLFKDQYAYVQAGAGIVYDSVPESEYNETLEKAMPLKEVI
jgi:anthranilate synthase component I